jgi:predicted ATP-dependent serine protease
LIQGEVGLTGEVREVAERRSRLREAARHGFRRVVTSGGRRRRGEKREEKLTLALAMSVEEAVALALQPGESRAAEA